MSTRYVWGKYNRKQVYVETRNPATNASFTDLSLTASNLTTANILKLATEYTFNKTYGTFTLKGDTSIVKINDNTYTPSTNADKYKYAQSYNNPNSDIYYNNSQKTKLHWNVDTRNNIISQIEVNLWDSNQANASPLHNVSYSRLSVGLGYEQGSSVGTVSSGTNNTYPQDGEANGYWYVFKGSDSIDPVSIEYSKTEQIYSGEKVIVTVNKTTPTYGGTVYYLYQYSIDGHTWKNSGEKTSSTNRTITIPEGSKQFQVRVLASDSYGFTSATYVYGSTLGVQNLKLYVGISNKSKVAEKMYIGVNGKAREVIKAYVGVNGKAKPFL